MKVRFFRPLILDRIKKRRFFKFYPEIVCNGILVSEVECFWNKCNKF